MWLIRQAKPFHVQTDLDKGSTVLMQAFPVCLYQIFQEAEDIQEWKTMADAQQPEVGLHMYRDA